MHAYFALKGKFQAVFVVVMMSPSDLYLYTQSADDVSRLGIPPAFLWRYVSKLEGLIQKSVARRKLFLLSTTFVVC